MFDSTPPADELALWDDFDSEFKELFHSITFGGGESPTLEGSVYLFSIVEMPGYYKIGISNDVYKRLQGYNSAFPLTIKLENSLKCDNHKTLERLLHQHFKDKRVKGEWFFLSDADVADCISFLNDRCTFLVDKQSPPNPIIELYIPMTVHEQQALDKKWKELRSNSAIFQDSMPFLDETQRAVMIDELRLGLWKRTTANLKQQLGLKKTDNLQNKQAPLAALYELIAELMSNYELMHRQNLDFNEAKQIVRTTSEFVGDQAAAAGRKLGIDIATDRPLLLDSN